MLSRKFGGIVIPARFRLARRNAAEARWARRESSSLTETYYLSALWMPDKCVRA
jgi:hypothetical protein